MLTSFGLGYQAPRSQFRVFAEPQTLPADGGRHGVGLNQRDMSRAPTARVHPLMSRPGRAASRVLGKGDKTGTLGLPVSPARSPKSSPAKSKKIGTLGLPVSPAATINDRLAADTKKSVSEDAESSSSNNPGKKFTHRRESSLVLSADELPAEAFGVEVGFDGDAEDSEEPELALDVASLDAVSLEAIAIDSLSQDGVSISSAPGVNISSNLSKPGLSTS